MAHHSTRRRAPPPSQARLRSLLAGLPDSGSPAQRQLLARYLELLGRWNRVHNLTAITDPEVLVRRHVAESLALAALLEGERIADLGSGAGLPGLVLAIAAPERRFWLLESSAKKARFLAHVRGELGLTHVEVYHGRAEHFPTATPFDTVVARAVAPIDRLVPLAGELIGRHGRLVALKGDKLEDELELLPVGFRVEKIEVLSSVEVDGPPPRAVVIRAAPAL